MPIPIKVEVYEPFKKSVLKDCQMCLIGASDNAFPEMSLRGKRLMFGFIETKLVGKEFQSKEELRKVLDAWPNFAKAKTGEEYLFHVPEGYGYLWINGSEIFATINLKEMLLKVATTSWA